MINIFIGLVFLILTQNVYSDVPKNTDVRYENGSVRFDYSGIAERINISSGYVEIITCSDSPENNVCASSEQTRRELVRAPFQVSIDEPGIFRLSIVDSDRGKYKRFDFSVWEQFVANLPVSSASIRELARQHAPFYSFHKSEKHYPVLVGSLFNMPLENYEFKKGYLYQPEFSNHTIDFSEDTAAEFMKYNGQTSLEITLKSEIAENITGTKDEFPVYWIFDQSSNSALYITYITFYGYDKKYSEYIVGSPVSVGNHAVDRESITVEFRQDANNNWQPFQVFYAGHLPSQPTTFLGCVDSDKCTAAGSKSSLYATSWFGGKTKISWDHVARIGARPIVYVAHGSHAHTPGYGYYAVDSNPLPLATVFDIEEASGNYSLETAYTPTSLLELDLTSTDASPLLFSGYVVNGAFDWYRAHPFIRNPISTWTKDAGNNFEICVATERGCEDYIHHENDVDGDGIRDEDDAFPFDPIFHVDSDGDGVPDERDAFPNDPTETSDLNNDGFGDNAVPVNGLTRFRGTVVDQYGEPIPRALVRIESIQSEFARDGIIQTRTNNSGMFLINSDLETLPNSFVISIAAALFVPDIFVVTKDELGTGFEFVLQEASLDSIDLNTIVIEPQPVIHHLGDDNFSDAINSQFQRSSEGLQYSRNFNVSEQQVSSQSFVFNIFAKGIQTRYNSSSSLRFNNNDLIILPQGNAQGEYTDEKIVLNVISHLVAGENTLTITSGYNTNNVEIDDYDDFEFINPVIKFGSD